MKIKTHKFIEYTILFLGVVLFAFFFWRLGKNTFPRILITALAAIFYSLWGIIHHLLEHRLTVEIALEYILISFFVFLLVLTALNI
jgi:hypothetical protein